MQAHDDHVLIALAGDVEPALRGELALLPRADLAPRDAGWEVGAPARLVCVRVRNERAAPRWIASRTEAALAELVVRARFGLQVRAALHGSACMLVVPTAGDAAARLIGKQGSGIAALREALGVERVFVAREPQGGEPFSRLACAVASVTGLKRRDYTVRMPYPGRDLPVIAADRAALPRLVGRGGQNLHFIRRLSGVAFLHAERGRASR